jgi:hypothetical protein
VALCKKRNLNLQCFVPPNGNLATVTLVAVLWVMTKCTDVVAYQLFGSYCLHFLHPEGGGRVTLRNVVIPAHHYKCHNPESNDMNLHNCETTSVAFVILLLIFYLFLYKSYSLLLTKFEAVKYSSTLSKRGITPFLTSKKQ